MIKFESITEATVIVDVNIISYLEDDIFLKVYFKSGKSLGYISESLKIKDNLQKVLNDLAGKSLFFSKFKLNTGNNIFVPLVSINAAYSSKSGTSLITDNCFFIVTESVDYIYNLIQNLKPKFIP